MLENLKIRPEYDGFLFLAESVRNPPRLASHHHVELEINLVLQGCIRYVVDGHSYSFDQRSLLWFFPSQEHQLVDRTPDARYYVAVFKPDLIRRACTSATYKALGENSPPERIPLQIQLEPESFDLVRKTMDSLLLGGLDPDLLNHEAGFGLSEDFSYQHSDPDGLNAGLRHLLLLSWRCRERGSALASPQALHPSVVKAIDLLSRNNELDLVELARRCGVSPAYLSRTFGRQIGVPLNHYRNSLRLSHFWDALRKPHRPTLTEAVYASGFGSYAQFFKVFQQAYGTSPRKALRRGEADEQPMWSATIPS